MTKWRTGKTKQTAVRLTVCPPLVLPAMAWLCPGTCQHTWDYAPGQLTAHNFSPKLSQRQLPSNTKDGAKICSTVRPLLSCVTASITCGWFVFVLPFAHILEYQWDQYQYVALAQLVQSPSLSSSPSSSSEEMSWKILNLLTFSVHSFQLQKDIKKSSAKWLCFCLLLSSLLTLDMEVWLKHALKSNPRSKLVRKLAAIAPRGSTILVLPLAWSAFLVESCSTPLNDSILLAPSALQTSQPLLPAVTRFSSSKFGWPRAICMWQLFALANFLPRLYVQSQERNCSSPFVSLHICNFPGHSFSSRPQV